MKVQILFAGSKEPVFQSDGLISVDENTADALKAAISAAIKAGKVVKKYQKKAKPLIDVNRQRITTVPPTVVANGGSKEEHSEKAKKAKGTVLQSGSKKSLQEYGLKEGDALLIKVLWSKSSTVCMQSFTVTVSLHLIISLLCHIRQCGDFIDDLGKPQ